MNSEQVTREILGNIPSWMAVALYVAAFVGLATAGWTFWRRTRRHRRGRPAVGVAREGTLAARIVSGLRYVTFHRQLLRDPFAGTAHLLTFYGFVILFIGTCLVAIEHDTPLHFFYGWFYLIASLVIDLGGLAFCVGLGMFLWRRHVRPPPRILRRWWVAAVGWLLLAIGVTGFLLEGLRIAVDFRGYERWSVVGYACALGFDLLGISGARAQAWHRQAWGVHAAVSVAFFALLPWRFFGHMAYGLMTWTSRRTRPRAALVTQPLSADRPPGAERWFDLTSLDLLQADGCTTCGRCTAACPAHAAGKPLSPREIVLGVRAAVDEGTDQPLSRWIDDAALWSCTTCSACNEACPVGIDVYDKIVDLRRGRVEAGAVPDAARAVFERVANDWNPFGRVADDRDLEVDGRPLPVAAEEEPVELLYWIGCSGRFDPDGKSVVAAMVRILRHLGIGFRILGGCERCTGDPARRLGEEALFQELADWNLRTLSKHRVRRILTHCPHCFNTLRNEYPHLAPGGDGAAAAPYEVIHHSQFLAELVAAGRLSAPGGQADGTTTFHDPCYLGRGNGVVDAPRDVLRGAGAKLVEMPRSREQSFCCGAGGGAMWVDVAGRDRVENIRAREAAATGATTVATGCPFCKGMLQIGRQSDAHAPGMQYRVRDLAELIAEAEGLQ